jgi:L-fuculose-phosphate aldolase
VNLEGEKLGGAAKRHSEVFIHTEIMRARPDVQSVVHTHAMHAVVFSSLGRELLAVGNDGTFFAGNLPIFDETTDLITTQVRGRAVAARLGPSMALILRNHGIATAGRTIEEAVWWALKLERACHAQLLAEAAGGPKLVGSTEDIKAKGAWANRTELHESVFAYLSRRYAPSTAITNEGEPRA